MLSEAQLQAIWYGGVEPRWWLRALTPLYRALSGLRRGLYTAGWLPRLRLPVPVVVVGNLTAGGAGKTPLVIALVDALRARGRKPGVISRGYGGSAARVVVVEAKSDPFSVGDEARLIFDATLAPVAIGRDRAAAGRALLDSAQADVLIADDGLQHYRLQRDIEICVIDGARRFGNGYLLPAGPLREPIARLATVDFRVCNGGAAQAGEVSMRLVGDEAIALIDPAQRRALRTFASRRVHAVAGIGNPQRFFAHLREANIDIIEHTFGDHHHFVPADLDFGDDLPLLMTDKDAVKCSAFARAHWWRVPVHAELPSAFFDAVASRLEVKCFY